MLCALAAISAPILPGWATGPGAARPFAPELILIGTIVAVLLAPFAQSGRANRSSGLIALLGTVLALVAAVVLAVRGGGDVGTVFRGMLLSDAFAEYWKILLLLFTAGVILIWFAASAAEFAPGDGPEFFTLLLGATFGMCVMASTTNLLMIFLAVEAASLPSYVLAGFRKTNRLGAEASLKYVLFGAASAAIMAYGLSLLYGLFGTLQLDAIGTAVARGEVAGAGASALFVLGLFGLLAGIGFKIAAVPFHFWCPDVFEGAAIDVSAFLSVASKGAALILLTRVLAVFSSSVPGAALTVGVLGAVTATVGNTAAFVQDNIKRLLAYSSIAHAGYMLCLLSLPGANSGSGVGGVLLLYLTVYMVMNLGAFTAAALVYRWKGGERLADYEGLGVQAPVLAASLAICLISLIGLPPLAGFNAKLGIMVALGQSGGWHWALVATIAVNTVLSLYYYFRIVKVMYLHERTEPAIQMGTIGTGLAAACAAALLWMFFAYGSLTSLTASFGRLHVEPVTQMAAAAHE